MDSKDKLNFKQKDSQYEGRDEAFMDIDRMVNEGLAGGQIIENATGEIDDTSTDEMKLED